MAPTQVFTGEPLNAVFVADRLRRRNQRTHIVFLNARPQPYRAWWQILEANDRSHAVVIDQDARRWPNVYKERFAPVVDHLALTAGTGTTGILALVEHLHKQGLADLTRREFEAFHVLNDALVTGHVPSDFAGAWEHLRSGHEAVVKSTRQRRWWRPVDAPEPAAIPSIQYHSRDIAVADGGPPLYELPDYFWHDGNLNAYETQILVQFTQDDMVLVWERPLSSALDAVAKAMHLHVLYGYGYRALRPHVDGQPRFNRWLLRRFPGRMLRGKKRAFLGRVQAAIDDALPPLPAPVVKQV